MKNTTTGIANLQPYSGSLLNYDGFIIDGSEDPCIMEYEAWGVRSFHDPGAERYMFKSLRALELLGFWITMICLLAILCTAIPFIAIFDSARTKYPLKLPFPGKGYFNDVVCRIWKTAENFSSPFS
jgi:hypothetical protein